MYKLISKIFWKKYNNIMKKIFNILIINLTLFVHYLNNLVKLVYQIPSTIIIKNKYFNLLLVTGIIVLILVRLGYLKVNLFDIYNIIYSNLLTLLILSFMLITLTTYIVYILINFCYRVYCTCCYINELIIYSLSQDNKDSMKISNSNFIRLDILITYILKNIFFILFSLFILYNIFNILDVDIFIIFTLFIFSGSIACLWLRWNDPYSFDNNNKNFNLFLLLFGFTLYVVYIYVAPELIQKFMLHFKDNSFLTTNTILSIKESKKAVLATTQIVPKLNLTEEEMLKHLNSPYKTSWGDIDSDGSFIFGNNYNHYAYTFSFKQNKNTDVSLSYFYFTIEEFLAYAKMKDWFGIKLGYDQIHFQNWDSSKLKWNIRQFDALTKNNITCPDYFKDLRYIYQNYLNYATLHHRLKNECKEFFLLYTLISESQNRHYLGSLKEIDDDENVLFNLVNHLSLTDVQLKLDKGYAEKFPYLYKSPNSSYFTILNFKEPHIKLIIDIYNLNKFTYRDEEFSDKFFGPYAKYLSKNIILNNFNDCSTLCRFKTLNTERFTTVFKISPIRTIFYAMNIDVIEMAKFADVEWSHKDQIKRMNEKMLIAAETDPDNFIHITSPSNITYPDSPYLHNLIELFYTDCFAVSDTQLDKVAFDYWVRIWNTDSDDLSNHRFSFLKKGWFKVKQWFS